ncbi:MAG: hypothetical protein IKS15_04895, partial [Opitutales bacterium]|nr:hypothetical protein [Opitutales bacterium]
CLGARLRSALFAAQKATHAKRGQLPAHKTQKHRASSALFTTHNRARRLTKKLELRFRKKKAFLPFALHLGCLIKNEDHKSCEASFWGA